MGFNYAKPSWAGKPCFDSLSLDLIVAGEEKRRVDLDVREHDAFLIGREKNCDVVLEGLEKMASRYHCVLQCKEGSPEIYVYDLKSSHGTVLNGKQLDPHKFEPMRVGGQLKFNAIRPSARDVLAVLCGPEEAMEEEGEIDLSAFREEAAKESAAREQAMLKDLERRKAAKKKRMQLEAQREAVAKAYASKAEERMKKQKELEAADKERIHQVTWGMGEDAVETNTEELHDDAKKLLDANGKLDLDKVRELQLTQKQDAMVQKLEQKQRKIANLFKEKQRQEDQAAHRAQQKAQANLDIDELPDSGMGSQNMERLAKLEEKIQKSEEDFAAQADTLFVSLGMKRAGFSERVSKRTAALYDTRDDQSDDEFFDRTAVQKASTQKVEESADIPSELMGLPTLDDVENQKSLEVKVSQLKTEQARVSAQLAAEKVKAKKQADQQEPEDSLDAFMNATVAELRQDRGDKLQRRAEVISERLVKFEAMLREAKKNTEEVLAAPVKRQKTEVLSAPAAPPSKSKNAPTSTAEVLARLTEKDAKAAAKAEKAEKKAEEEAASGVLRAPARAGPAEPKAEVKVEAPGQSPSTPATPAPAEPAPKATAMAPPARAPPKRVHIDPERAGLQCMAPEPAAKKKKVYGVAMPPSRDLDQAASGE